jgi:hypothetical protein
MGQPELVILARKLNLKAKIARRNEFTNILSQVAGDMIIRRRASALSARTDLSSKVWPSICTSAFGRRPPMRVPNPAAGITPIKSEFIRRF